MLNSTVVVLAKRHGQLKEAVVRMIDEVITFLPAIREKTGEAAWLEALKSLRGITEGKVRRLSGSLEALGGTRADQRSTPGCATP